MSAKSKKINFIAKNQSFYNDVIEKFGGSGDYKCVYFPEIYQGICAFLLRLTSEEYLESTNTLDFAISEIGRAHYRLQEDLCLDETQKFKIIIQSIDQILINARQRRSVTNRSLGVQLIFPDYFDSFTKWFEDDYIEESFLVNREDYDFLVDLLPIINKELAFLSKGPRGQDLKKKFLECMAPLLK